jgi:type II secretory pathway component PulF
VKSVKAFFYPLIALVVGFGGLIIFLMFRSQVSNSVGSMAANVTAANPDVATKIYAWGLISSGPGVVGLCIVIILGFIIWYMFKGWIKGRYGGG